MAVKRKRGNHIGFWFFRIAIAVSGLRGAYGLLHFVALHYLFFDRAAVAASMAYIKRRFPKHSTIRHIWDVYQLFISQGKSLIDRYYVNVGGTGIQIEIEGYDQLNDLLSTGKGIILLTAHVGNWQVAMTALIKLNKPVYLIMRPEDNTAIKTSLHVDSEHDTIKIISNADPVGCVVEAIKAISGGDLVSIMGDRTYGYNSLEATFFDNQVAFPYGAFSIAAAVQCPVVVLLSAKVGPKKYIVDVTNIIEPPTARRDKQQFKICVQKFAAILESYAHHYPYQWFVFRDMWKGNY